MALSNPYPRRSKDGPAGVVFVLDSSWSIGEDDWQVTLQYATQIMEGLRNRANENLSSAVTWIKSDNTKHKNLQEYVSDDPDAAEVVHLAVVVYSTNATTHWDLNVRKSTEQLTRDIQALGFNGGSTDTYDGLLHAENIFKLSTTVYSKHIVVLITDGHSDDRQGTIRQAESMHANGVEIFVIGVGSVSRDEMNQVGSKPVSEHCHYVMNHAALQATAARIITVTYTAVQREIKPQLAAAPEPEAPEPEAPRALELEDYMRREFIQLFVLLLILFILNTINSMFGWE